MKFDSIWSDVENSSMGLMDNWKWWWYRYRWWKKSCTSWYGRYPIIYRVSYMFTSYWWEAVPFFDTALIILACKVNVGDFYMFTRLLQIDPHRLVPSMLVVGFHHHRCTKLCGACWGIHLLKVPEIGWQRFSLMIYRSTPNKNTHRKTGSLQGNGWWMVIFAFV